VSTVTPSMWSGISSPVRDVGQHVVQRFEQSPVGACRLHREGGGEPEEQRPVASVEAVQQRQVVVAVVGAELLVLGRQLPEMFVSPTGSNAQTGRDRS
jgi:hypothetical protein